MAWKQTFILFQAVFCSFPTVQVICETDTYLQNQQPGLPPHLQTQTPASPLPPPASAPDSPTLPFLGRGTREEEQQRDTEEGEKEEEWRK